jgi:hypothetical protein
MVIRSRPVPEEVAVSPVAGQMENRAVPVALGTNQHGLLVRLDHATALSAAVYDAAGRQVVQLSGTRLFPAGQHLLAWPDRRILPNGMYIARVNLNGQSSVQRSFTHVR